MANHYHNDKQLEGADVEKLLSQIPDPAAEGEVFEDATLNTATPEVSEIKELDDANADRLVDEIMSDAYASTSTSEGIAEIADVQIEDGMVEVQTNQQPRANVAKGKPTISFRNTSVVYESQPNKPALDNLNIDIYPGEFVFLVGHSGSGKSTFIKLVTREIKATSGKVIVAGQDLTTMRNWKVPYLRRQLGCVFQDFKLLSNKTIYENVAFALECIGKPKSVIEQQVPEVLRLVGLADRMDSYPDQLSGGEQQRVSVARAMVNRPPLLVCDEPTGNLDPAISQGIMKLLERINETGTTVLMATHDRDMVNTMRKRVIALESGHVVRDEEGGGYGNYVGF